MLQLPVSCLGASASDGCQEGCEEGREEVSTGARGLSNRGSQMILQRFFRQQQCTSRIISLEAGGLWDDLSTWRLTSSGLAQGCEEGGEEDREEGAEEEGLARDRGAFR